MMTATEVKKVTKKVEEEPLKKVLTVTFEGNMPVATFQGHGWTTAHVKMTWPIIVRAFKEYQRELFRKGNKK